jgi:hypothetical protein
VGGGYILVGVVCVTLSVSVVHIVFFKCLLKAIDRGVDKFFKTLAKSENNWPHLQKLSVRGEKNYRRAGE